MSQRKDFSDSNFNITQSVIHQLYDKYYEQFSFFKAKDINILIFTEKTQQLGNYQESLIYSEDIEYLKKSYLAKNDQGRNQLKQRMRLLRNYYAHSDLLKFEVPMMVINRVQDIFLKRQKLFRKMKKQEESEEEQQSDQEQMNSTSEIKIVKQIPKGEEFIVDLSWSAIVAGKFEEQNEEQQDHILKPQIQLDEEQYSTFGSQIEIKRINFLKKMGIIKDQEKIFSLNTAENNLNHLVIDFDDLDKTEILNQYEKLMNKENYNENIMAKSPLEKKNKIKSVFESRKPMSSSVIVEPQVPVKKKDKPLGIMQQSMLIGSRQQRMLETKIIKRSSMAQISKPNNFHFDEDQYIISEKSGEQSPFNFQQKYQSLFIPQSQQASRNFQTTTFGKKQGISLNITQIAMKEGTKEQPRHSEMHVREDEEQIWDTSKIRNDLLRIKEKPIEHGYLLNNPSKDVKNSYKEQYKLKEKEEKQGLDGLAPSKTLSRVRSVENLGNSSSNFNFTRKYR